jgi:hypothetical protein
MQLHEGEVSPRVSLTSNLVSFKNVVRNKPSNFVSLNYPLLSVYIVENYEAVPKLEVFELDAKELISFYKSSSLTCKFNGF